MAKAAKTTVKRQPPANGVKFSAENQPDAAAKSAGWQEWRKERHLTQSIIAHMIGTDGKPKKAFKEYIESLIKNAMMGNPKAIETINKGLEDDILKIANTDTNGNDLPIKEDLSKLSDAELRTLAELQRKCRTGQA